MATWIFQGNPNIFDIDGYLEACSGDFHWQVGRYQENLSIGDKVYIWRSQDKSKDKTRSGIIAEARVADSVQHTPPDKLTNKFWVSPGGESTPKDRVRLRFDLDF